MFYVGEALAGEGNEIAHIDLLIGDKYGPVGLAFANALADQKLGHRNLLAVLTPNLMVKPATVMVTKVSVKVARNCGNRLVVLDKNFAARVIEWAIEDMVKFAVTHLVLSCQKRERERRNSKALAAFASLLSYCAGRATWLCAALAFGCQYVRSVRGGLGSGCNVTAEARARQIAAMNHSCGDGWMSEMDADFSYQKLIPILTSPTSTGFMKWPFTPPHEPRKQSPCLMNLNKRSSMALLISAAV